MLSRLGSGVLLLCVLAASAAAADMHPSMIPHHEAGLDNPGPESTLFSDIDGMWLYVVKSGRVEKMLIDAGKMTAPFIDVDGYVNGVELVSKTPLRAYVNRRPLAPAGTAAHPNLVMPDPLARSIHSVSNAPPPAGRYTCFPTVPGDALCKTREFPISLQHNGREQRLIIRQTAPATVNISGGPVSGGDAPQFFYLGNAQPQFETLVSFPERLKAIRTGIRTVERATAQQRLVTRIYLLDYDGPHNAYTCKDRKEIWLYAQTFRNERVAELRTMAEHEALHLLVDRLGIASGPHMRELYNQLKRSPSDARPVAPANALRSAPAGPDNPGAWTLFDFINETNYLRGMHGGHAQDNMDEFCVSFLHTLIYVDRLAGMLSSPIKKGDGSLVALSRSGQRQLLEAYQRVLDAMVADLPDSLTVGCSTYFRACRRIAFEAGAHINTGDISSWGDHDQSPVN